MDVRIYNTLSRSKEVFTPVHPGRAGFYQCGPTMYSVQHVGNMRAVVMGDLIARVLRYAGYELTFVRNYTDVGHLVSDGDEGEDKIEKGVRREGLDPKALTEKYIAIYDTDTAKLNATVPDVRPKATEYIQEMIDMVQVLLDKGLAYPTELAIYFDTAQAKEYHRLSGQKAEENIEGAGSGDVSDPNKRNPEDFALWFFKAGAHKNALQYWSSPFSSPLVQNGEGFPGWHIECSAMSKKNLGDTFDIHMGGVEHIPVHHANEIAQSEGANGVTPANYWIHNEHLLVNGGKMSKSDGTGHSLSDLEEKGFSPLALRYFFLQAHYRSKQNFTLDALQAAQNGLGSLYRQVASLGTETGSVNGALKDEFLEAVTDDFNVPKALAVVSKVFKTEIAAADKRATLLDFDQVLGLDLEKATEDEVVPEDVMELVSLREKARVEKNWNESDRLRGLIVEKGYDVLDTPEGSRVRKK